MFGLIAALAGLAALVLVGALLLPLAAWLAALRQFLAGLGPGGAVLFVAIAVLSTGTLTPAAPFSLVAGLMFGAAGLPVAIASATGGACLAFFISRHFLRARMAWPAALPGRVQDFDRAIGAGGWRMVALIRLSPLIPFNVQNLLFGASRVGFWPFIGGTVVGAIPNTAFYVYLGAAGRASADARDPIRWALLAAGLVATLLAAVLLTRAARRRTQAMLPPTAVRPAGEPG